MHAHIEQKLADFRGVTIISPDPKIPSTAQAAHFVVVGQTRVFDCCDFVWEEPEGGDERVVELRPEHCPRCIEELRNQGVRFRRALPVSA